MTDRIYPANRLNSRKARTALYLAGFGAVSAMAAVGISQTLPTTLMTNPASGPLVTTSPSTTFASWFTGGAPGTLNAAVSPADSLNFSNNTANRNTDFYRWSYRMFLWLTSPTPATYGGTGLVLSSPEFYNVSANAAGQLVMTANPRNPFIRFGPVRAAQLAKEHPAPPLQLGVRTANLGPHGLRTVHDAQGHFFEVLPAKLSPAGRPLLSDAAGREVELAHVVFDTRGTARFLDTAGRAIAAPRPAVRPLAMRTIGLREHDLRALTRPQFVLRIDPSLIAGGRGFRRPIFILPNGAVLDTVIGDSDGNVQLTQNGSVIYYNMAVNDVYAYYVTQINPVVTGNSSAQFPTTQGPANNPPVGTLGSLEAFAAARGHTFLNPNALAIELKTAWVDAASLSNPASYITMRAVVPTFDKSNPKQWTQNGTRTITAALIGIHVVGSTAGHPEMVWSTFEHFGNTPNVGYAFTNSSGSTVQHAADPATSSPQWLFTAPGANLPAPGASGLFVANAKASFSGVGVANGVTAVNGTNAVVGTSVSRPSPWGASANQKPNPLIGSIAKSNTQVISLNNDIHGQMNPADVRNNYFFLGATWTEGGAAPTGLFPFGNVVGTSFLANSTLETFSQPLNLTSTPGQINGCLTCHGSNTVGVSHIFGQIVALP